MTARWVVEKGPIEVPEYLRVCRTLSPVELVWTDDEGLATRFDTSDEAMAAATETRVEALRVTELEE